MGVRQKPERLGEKLRQIRDALGVSQTEMLKRLGVANISSFTTRFRATNPVSASRR